MLDCSNLLSECMVSHMEQAETLLFSLPINPNEWSQTMDNCQDQQRYRRSAGKARSRGGSLGRAISQTSIGRSLTHSSVLSRKSSTSESVLRGLLGMWTVYVKKLSPSI